MEEVKSLLRCHVDALTSKSLRRSREPALVSPSGSYVLFTSAETITALDAVPPRHMFTLFGRRTSGPLRWTQGGSART